MSLVPVIPIDLPGKYKTFGLKFTFNSAAKLKEWAGCNILAAENPLGSLMESTEPGDGDEPEIRQKFVMDPVLLRVMLAACLYHRDRGITPDDAGDLITAENLGEVTNGVTRAFLAYFGTTPEALKDDPPRPTKEATGAIPSASISSGPSLGTTSGSPNASSGG